MLAETLKTLFVRDLNRLKDEIQLYNKEENLWVVDKQILNSAGNLCLHLIGNLNTYIGAEFGGTGYIRNRPEEFSLKNIPRAVIVGKIEDTIRMLEAAVGTLTEEQLENEYPQLVLAGKTSTQYFLIHLAMHLSYHLGQINYHRRLLDI